MCPPSAVPPGSGSAGEKGTPAGGQGFRQDPQTPAGAENSRASGRIRDRSGDGFFAVRAHRSSACDRGRTTLVRGIRASRESAAKRPVRSPFSRGFRHPFGWTGRCSYCNRRVRDYREIRRRLRASGTAVTTATDERFSLRRGEGARIGSARSPGTPTAVTGPSARSHRAGGRPGRTTGRLRRPTSGGGRSAARPPPRAPLASERKGWVTGSPLSPPVAWRAQRRSRAAG